MFVFFVISFYSLSSVFSLRKVSWKQNENMENGNEFEITKKKKKIMEEFLLAF